PEFLPAKIEVKQGLSIDGRTEDVKYEFGSMFNSIDSSISANFHYKEYSNISNDFETFIQPTNVTETIATVSLANSLLTSYFISPHNISDCQTKETMSYCENFQILSEGKRGYGIAIVNGTSKSMSIVFNCFVPKESKDYETQKSCIKPF
ncbi:MAG: hypothetical protein Q8P29_04025, partial [Candidatus Levybacteria bacterium]|nr:hypothetical protein [Candidatus Levybacteria bacterium]